MQKNEEKLLLIKTIPTVSGWNIVIIIKLFPSFFAFFIFYYYD
ncbi:hypothetical protein BSM4216_2207 [Bacillus smithii]|nr:hypothetical protein BSM4216_2207 [Bacillus smithii]